MEFDYSKAKDIATRLFKVNFPIDEKELKSKYRSLCKEYHPDINKEVDKSVIIEINTGYEYLISLLETHAFSDNKFRDESNVTINDKSIYEYGKGLGPFINGIECEICKGKGYEKHSEYVWGKRQLVVIYYVKTATEKDYSLKDLEELLDVELVVVMGTLQIMINCVLSALC